MTKIDALLDNYEKSKLERVSVIHDTTVVAFVYVDKNLDVMKKIEEAFMSTNSITGAWWDNDNVEALFEKGGACRSTSVGDTVLVGNTKYKCDNAGWSKV